MEQRERLELEALKIMADSAEPIGSMLLGHLLGEAGFDISSSTAGRLLIQFDYDGLTDKQGFRGRLLTEKGKTRMEDLKLRLKLMDLSVNFYNSLDADSKDTLINVLTARRGIEREIARLAAANAGPEDIRDIKRNFENQLEKVASGGLTYEVDLAFHRCVAKAGKNGVLAAAYDFIWQNGRFALAMEYVRKQVGGKIADDHGKILAAIELGNADAAERAMVGHIDGLISDVNKYWALSTRSGAAY